MAGALSPFDDEGTEAQRGWLEHFPRVPRLRIPDFALGTAGGGVGWVAGRVSLLGEDSMMAVGSRVLGGAVVGTVCLTFGLGVIVS